MPHTYSDPAELATFLKDQMPGKDIEVRTLEGHNGLLIEAADVKVDLLLEKHN